MNYNQKINTLIQGRSNFNLVAPKPVVLQPKTSAIYQIESLSDEICFDYVAEDALYEIDNIRLIVDNKTYPMNRIGYSQEIIPLKINQRPFDDEDDEYFIPIPEEMQGKSATIMYDFSNDSPWYMCQQISSNNYNFTRYKYVDLGLPSGTLWATMNVGATNITDYGNYYMYGMGNDTYDSADTISDYYRDTASEEWGQSEWHTPTKQQFEELIDNTTSSWKTNYQNSNINGILFTSQNNGNSVFFPATGEKYNNQLRDVNEYGYYWSSSSNGSENAYNMQFFNNDDQYIQYNQKTLGFSVRPVTR